VQGFSDFTVLCITCETLLNTSFHAVDGKYSQDYISKELPDNHDPADPHTPLWLRGNKGRDRF
jgi:hypothetical protein